MTKTVDIEEPNGYMEDSDGKVCFKFGNWAVGSHTVPDYVSEVHYVDGPADHDVDIHDDYRDMS